MADSRTDLLVVGRSLSFWREQMPAACTYGLTKGCPSAAKLGVDEMLR